MRQRVRRGSDSVEGLFICAVAVWASPDVICRDLALVGLTSDICFPTMWPLYFEARWQMMPPKQTTHKHPSECIHTHTHMHAHAHAHTHVHRQTCIYISKHTHMHIDCSQSSLPSLSRGGGQQIDLSPKIIYKVLIECQKVNLGKSGCIMIGAG